jgi:23S rRNA pseudouridine2605 synthase
VAGFKTVDAGVSEMTESENEKSAFKAEPKLVRLNKLLAERGLASRRGADKLIEEGLVMVNQQRSYRR